MNNLRMDDGVLNIPLFMVDETDRLIRLTLPILKEMLNERFATVDFEAAKKDVIDFIRNSAELDVWGAPFFSGITDKLSAMNHAGGKTDK